MRGWTKALLLAALVCAAAAACAREGQITTPDGARPQMDGAPSQDPATTQSDSGRDGRWGGFIGSGG